MLTEPDGIWLESTDSRHRKAASPSALYICKAYADELKSHVKLVISRRIFPKAVASSFSIREQRDLIMERKRRHSSRNGI